MKNIVCGVILTTLVLSMLTLVTDVRPVKAWTWSGTVYIRADGSVDPPTAPILRNGDLYTLTENIDCVYGMVIERNNMTLDGASKILQHVGVHDLFVGIWLSGTTNVTITNIVIKDFDYGVHLEKSFNNKVSENQFTGSSPALVGMRLESSSHNIISDNNMTGWVYWSLYLNESSNNAIYRNILAVATFEDVFLKGSSSNNTIYNNNFSVPRFSNAESNFFDNGYPSGGNYYPNGPKIADFFHGPYQNETGSDGILDSPIGPDRYPLVFPINSPPRPPVAELSVIPTYGTWYVKESITFKVSYMLPGWNGTDVMPLVEYLWDFGDGNITTSANASIDHMYEEPRQFTATLTVVDSQGLSSAPYTKWISTLLRTSLSISTGSPSTFVGYAVNVNGTLQDLHGALQNQTVVLYYTFSGTDEWVPITSDTTDQFGDYHIVWIPPATGYFTIIAEWLGDEAHERQDATVSLSSIPYQNQYVFSVESNSTVSSMTFNSTSSELSFLISGVTGTRGYVKATIAKSLVANIADLHVYVDGTQTEYSVDSLGDTWVLTFMYNHSTHYVKVGWTRQSTFDLVQYIPIIAAIAVVAVAVVVSVAVIKRRRQKKT